jgi:xanthine dehydrogenase accessory factor
MLVSGRFSRGGPGAKLAVGASGESVGAFPVAIAEAVLGLARTVLDGAPAQLLRLGSFEVWVQRYIGGRFGEVGLAGGRAAEVTLLAGAAPGAKLVVEPDGRRTGSLGAPELDDEAARLAEELIWKEISERRGTMFIDVLVPPPRLLVFGAGEIARCLSRVGRVTGWQVYVIDPIAGEEVVVGEPEEAVPRLGGIDRATSVVVISHDLEFAVRALALALRSPARFIGAMGSRRTQAARREGLLGLGFDAGDWERVSAPVGLDLGATEPEETALSILAEAVAARHGRSGGRVALRAGDSIHEVVR